MSDFKEKSAHCRKCHNAGRMDTVAPSSAETGAGAGFVPRHGARRQKLSLIGAPREFAPCTSDMPLQSENGTPANLGACHHSDRIAFCRQRAGFMILPCLQIIHGWLSWQCPKDTSKTNGSIASFPLRSGCRPLR